MGSKRFTNIKIDLAFGTDSKKIQVENFLTSTPVGSD